MPSGLTWNPRPQDLQSPFWSGSSVQDSHRAVWTGVSIGTKPVSGSPSQSSQKQADSTRKPLWTYGGLMDSGAAHPNCIRLSMVPVVGFQARTGAAAGNRAFSSLFYHLLSWGS